MAISPFYPAPTGRFVPSGMRQPMQSAWPTVPQVTGQAVWLLGHTTRLDADGNVQMNFPMIETLAQYPAQVLPSLRQLLETSQHPAQVLEGLYLAQRIAQQTPLPQPTRSAVYASASRFNDSAEPLLQIYLAGLYRALNVPESVGPLQRMLLRDALRRPVTAGMPPPYHPATRALDPAEEIGGTLLHQLATYRPSGR